MVETAKVKRAITPKSIFATVEEAKANRPANKPKWQIFQVVRPDGSRVFLWNDGYAGSVFIVARKDGYSATPLDKAPSPEKIKGMLASLSEDERIALLAEFSQSKPVGKKGK
jgi:hypothetical protein